MEPAWVRIFCDAGKRAPWTFGSAHIDQGLLYWWYAVARDSYRDLVLKPLTSSARSEEPLSLTSFADAAARFAPHLHFGGSPKPWSDALLGYDANVWGGTWGYPTPQAVQSFYVRIAPLNFSFPIVINGEATALSWRLHPT